MKITRFQQLKKERETYKYKSSKYYKLVEKNMTGSDYDIADTPVSSRTRKDSRLLVSERNCAFYVS